MPPMAAMTGLALVSTMRIKLRKVGSAVVLGVLNSRMSAPLENALPAPMRMTASTRAVGPPKRYPTGEPQPDANQPDR